MRIRMLRRHVRRLIKMRNVLLITEFIESTINGSYTKFRNCENSSFDGSTYKMSLHDYLLARPIRYGQFASWRLWYIVLVKRRRRCYKATIKAALIFCSTDISIRALPAASRISLLLLSLWSSSYFRLNVVYQKNANENIFAKNNNY